MPIINFSQPEAYDTDASAYFTTAGVTTRAEQQQISRFVTGVKNLGLYSTMVCWPLRFGQNAQSGTTAYSLGGLGAYNGTLSGTISRGASGVSLSSGHSFYASISAAVRSLGGYSSILVASDSGSAGTVNFGVLKGGGSNQIGDNYTGFSRFYNFLTQQQSSLTGGTAERKFGDLTFNGVGFQFFGSSRTGLTSPTTDTGFVKLNATVNSTLSGTGVLPSTNPYAESFFMFGGSSGAENVYSFCMVAAPMSTTNMESIRGLYKTTLGTGLGLP